MSNTKETRQESYQAILPKIPNREELILDVLEGRQMTASEVAMELFVCGFFAYYDRVFAAPRLTNLEHKGKVRTVGKRMCERTGRREAVYEKVKEMPQ